MQPTVTNTENILDILAMSENNVACLANNHILDAGTKGIEFTLKSLKRKNFSFLGAGRNLDEASKPLVVNVKDKKIGLLNYNFIGWNKFGFFFNVFGATIRRPGANFANRQKIVEDIMEISDKVDHIITIMHTGRELEELFSIKELEFLESLKVDLINIHHAHIAQSISSNKIISCGDFIFNYPEHLPENRLAKLILCTCEKNIDVSIIELEIREGIACVK
jgi:poly-gamma-glutamate synthesis protein (capsule biosynthesis protein)